MVEDIFSEVINYIDKEMNMSDEDVMADCKTSIGSKMAYCREVSFFTQKQMEKLLDIKASTLSKYENDVILPPLKVLFRFAKCFEIPMEKFVDDTITVGRFSAEYPVFHFIKFRILYKICYKD